MLELREAKLYEHALPELEDELNRCARRADLQQQLNREEDASRLGGQPIEPIRITVQ